MDLTKIDSIAVYPPIGIARIGNSPEYFLASEIPGVFPQPSEGYKDSLGRIKKQAVKFRLYAFDKSGKVLGEITNEELSINWHVHVANVKAAWYEFNNALDLPQAGIPSVKRNEKEKNRSQLAIKPSPVEISGQNITDDQYSFDDGSFYGKKVNLGKVETDNEGRVIFVPGNGGAESKDNKPPTTFANNVGWHDDTCDGVIRASVTIDGKVIEATPAMVAVTPPNYGAGLYGVVTMNDVVQNLFINEMNYPDPAKDGVVFYEHIYPILERMTDTQWVNEGFAMVFGHNSPANFKDETLRKLLENPSGTSYELRQTVFQWFRDPASKEYKPELIPPFYGDGFNEYRKLPIVDLPVTQVQYDRLKKWADGAFTTGSPIVNKSFDKLSLSEQLDALNQAPLEECLGGPFHPGIELTWPMRVKRMWEAPYRLKTIEKGEDIQLDYGPLLSPQIALSETGPLSVSGPGSLTRWLGVPWQTDEASCLSGYNPSTYLPLPSFWAARVPNQVLSMDGLTRVEDEHVPLAQRLKHFDYRQDWLRDLGTQYLSKIDKMVHRWHNLGIIAPHDENISSTDGILPAKVWVETGRPLPITDPSFAQVEYAEENLLDAIALAKQKAQDATQGKSPKKAKAALAKSAAPTAKVVRVKKTLDRSGDHTTYERHEM